MVEQVTAYKASDGKLFHLADQASAHEAKQVLTTIPGLNEGLINLLIEHAGTVVHALTPVASMRVAE